MLLYPILFYAITIILTMVVIWRASDDFESASAFIGDSLNLKEGVRGLLLMLLQALFQSCSRPFSFYWF